MTQSRIGGSFAPPLDAATLEKYRALAATASPEVKEIMEQLCTMCEAFDSTPRSKAPGKPHPSGRGTIVPLEDAEIKRMWDLVPWPYECNAYAQLFEKIHAKAQTALRNAAHHLLWYARELTLDREPLTNDQL